MVAAIVEGPRAIAAFRQIAGGTDPVEKAAPGTIRGDLALVTQDNLVHGSDSPESAAREIALWFPGQIAQAVQLWSVDARPMWDTERG